MAKQSLLIGISVAVGIAVLVTGIVYGLILSESSPEIEQSQQTLNVNWIGAFANVTDGTSPLSVSFKAQDFSQNRFGNISYIEWNFGDDTSSTSQNPTHTYQTPGTFDVILTATWEDGTTQNTNLTVKVTELIDVVKEIKSIGEFTVTIDPPKIKVQQYHFGSTINVMVNSLENFSGNVSLKVEGLPDTMFEQWLDGNTLVIQPGGEGSVRLRIGESNGETELGSYEASIVAESDNLSSTTKFTVTVVEMGQMMTGMGGGHP